VKTTQNGIQNPDLMQSHNGVESAGNWASREEQLSIVQMIRDGAAGTGYEIGLRSACHSLGQFRVFTC